MIVFGHRYYGKTDVVPGLFHVATSFYFLQYIPLIPRHSSLILADSTRHSWSGTTHLALNLELSGKSIALAYGRFALWAGFIAAASVFSLETYSWLYPSPYARYAYESAALPGGIVALGVAAAVLGALLYWSYRAVIASEARALELGRLVGIADDVVLRHLRAGAKKRATPKPEAPRSQAAPKPEVRAVQCRKCGTTLDPNITAEDSKGRCPNCGARASRLFGAGGKLLLVAIVVAVLAVGTRLVLH